MISYYIEIIIFIVLFNLLINNLYIQLEQMLWNKCIGGYFYFKIENCELEFMFWL